MLSAHDQASESRTYLPVLDGLRFLAFFSVFVFHFPKLPNADQIPVLGWIYYRLSVFGWAGVDLFFCLSAFLIVRLLLQEHARFGGFDIGKYFIRRVLRIWPLYFLFIAIGFVVLPLFGGSIGPAWGSDVHASMVARHLLAMLGFFENFMQLLVGTLPSFVMQHLWTISVEEQVYLLLPLFAAAFIRWPVRVWAPMLAAVLLFGVLIRTSNLAAGLPDHITLLNPFARPDAFVFGALAGWLSLHPMRARFSGPGALAIGLGLLIAATYAPANAAGSWHALWFFPAIGAGFSLVLLHVALDEWPVWRWVLGNPVLAWLGKIFYGLYVYHRLGTALAIDAYKRFLTGVTASDGAAWVLVLLLALALTLIFSAVSYYAFERWFLVLKARYTRVASRHP